jgi:hypothetical protein
MMSLFSYQTNRFVFAVVLLLGVIVTLSTTTTKTSIATVQAFHMLQQCSVVRSSTARVGEPYNQLGLYAFVPVSLKLSNFIDDKNDPTNDETETKQSRSVLIWFQLFDSEDGQPYRNTTVSTVTPPPGSLFILDQFRDAVKAKYANTLCDIDSPDLVVYKNKAAFEAKDDPLGVGLSLTERTLGQFMNDAVVVLVPPPSVPPKSKQQILYLLSFCFIPVLINALFCCSERSFHPK